MATKALKISLPIVDEQRLGGLSEAERWDVYANAGYSQSQINHIEAMVADSGLRLVGGGAKDNVRVQFASLKNHAVRVIESHTCERMFAYMLELDPDVLGYYVQVPCRRIVRIVPGGGQHVSQATLDFLVFRRDGVELVECKAEEWLLKHEAGGEWRHDKDGWTCLPYQRWAEERGFPFRVFGLASPFANHLRALEAMYASLDLPLTPEELRIAKRSLALLDQKPLSIEDISQTIPGFNERIALSLLAGRQCYGLVTSTPITLPQHFYLYSDREQARMADLHAFDALMQSIEQPGAPDPITTASITDYKTGLRRLERVERFEAGIEKGSVRTRQLAAKVREAVSQGKPPLSACLTRYAQSGNREARLDPVQQECITWVIRALWNRGKARTRKNLWFKLEEECKRHHVATPSRETLDRYVRQEDAARRALATGGLRAYQAARPISDPSVRSGKALGYGHTLHIDSSKFDGRCKEQIEEAFSTNIPWFYIGIDEATDKPMARSIYFGKACTNGVALLLRDFVRRHGFLPFVIVLDRGSENDSKWLKAFCLKKGITMLQAPTGGSRYNGQAENAIGRINDSVAHDLPGSTEPDQKGRKVDGKYKSERTARLVFDVLLKALDDYVFGDFPNTPMDGDRTPNERQDEAMGGFGVVGKLQAMDDDLLIETSVNVDFKGKATEKRGIKIASGLFTSASLSLLLRTSQPEEVRQDCENGSLLFVNIAHRWVKAFKNSILTIASMTPEERLFEHLWAPYARRSRRRRKQAVDRARYQRHEAITSEDEAASIAALADPKLPIASADVNEAHEEAEPHIAWDNYTPLKAEV